MTAATSTTQALIDPKLLISPDMSEFARKFAFPDRVLNVYLHSQTGTTSVSGGVYKPQDIQTVAFDQSLKDFAQQFLKGLETKLNLKVQFVDQSAQANLRYYLDKKIDVGDSEGQSTVGITLTNQTNSGNFFEIMLSANLLDDQKFTKFALVHETAHSLGLEHPFDNSDGDVFLSTDPWSGADVSDTVMAYRSSSGVFDVTDFTSNDINALQSIWGTPKPAVRQTVAKSLPPVRQSTVTSAPSDIVTGAPTPPSTRRAPISTTARSSGSPPVRTASRTSSQPATSRILPRTIDGKTTPVARVAPASRATPSRKAAQAGNSRLVAPMVTGLPALQPWSAADPFPPRDAHLHGSLLCGSLLA